MAGNYGLGGAGLSGVGLQQKNQAMGLMSRAADQEAERERANKALEEQRQAGNAQLGSSAGAMIGFAAGGPVGALVGGIVGALGSKLF